jgi:hypothetical protein
MAAKKPKLRKGEKYVRVLDPKGQIFEVAGRNAHDLVTHNGWSYEKTEEDEVNEQAHAPRRKKDKGGKALPKGVESPADRKERSRKIPAKRNTGPGPAPEKPQDKIVKEAVIDDLDEYDEGNASSDSLSDASLVDLDD